MASRTLRGGTRALQRLPLLSSSSTTARRSFTSSARVMSSFYQSWEPKGPSVKTEIPGPKAKEAIAELNQVFDTRSLNMLTDYYSSSGNYIVDPDGNTLLDV